MTKYLLYLYECNVCQKPKKCQLRIFGSSAKPEDVPCIFNGGYTQKWKLIKKIGAKVPKVNT
jgi:hypothetical protein